MTVSRSKRAANNKWDTNNMKIVACKIKKAYADEFAQYAANKGTTVNALLKEYIYKCINKTD